MPNIYSGLDYTSTYPGYQLGRRHIDIQQIGDLPAEIQPPQVLEPAMQMESARLLQLFRSKGKTLTKAKGIGNVVAQWYEPNAYPRSYKSQLGTGVTTYPSDETSLYFTENAGIEPHVILYNPDTGEEIFVKAPQHDDTPMTSMPNYTNLADPDSYGWEVERGYGSTTEYAFTAGDRWLRLYKAAAEGGYSSWGTGQEVVMRSTALTDMRFSAHYSEHLHNLKVYAGTRGVKERLTEEDREVMESIEFALWFMSASSATAGTVQQITSIVTPQSTEATEDFRAGDGVIPQLCSGAHQESFAGSFDGDQFDEIIETMYGFKPAAKPVMFLGRHAISGMTRWAENKNERIRVSENASKFWMTQNLKSWVTASGRTIPLIPTPVFNLHPRTQSMAVVLNTKNTEFLHMNGMAYSGKMTKREQANDQSSVKYGTGMLSMGVAVKDLLSHALLTNIYP